MPKSSRVDQQLVDALRIKLQTAADKMHQGDLAAVKEFFTIIIDMPILMKGVNAETCGAIVGVMYEVHAAFLQTMPPEQAAKQERLFRERLLKMNLAREAQIARDEA